MFREAGLQVAQEATLSAALRSHRILWGALRSHRIPSLAVVFPFPEFSRCPRWKRENKGDRCAVPELRCPLRWAEE
ncbi:hypothetical protein ACTHSJ_14805 [Paenibacillus cellulositrophicus]|uniref:hypothetical protein n=1 Tax=Paenibacillus cellulositrophicus TaxID=562959 RepID=UPI003F7DD8EE